MLVILFFFIPYQVAKVSGGVEGGRTALTTETMLSLLAGSW